MKQAIQNLEKELECIATAPVLDLRNRWLALFKEEPPKGVGPDLLRRGIAHRLQLQQHGVLKQSTQRLLEGLIKIARKQPIGKLDLPRQIKPGSELVRTWKGKSYKVVVQENGFSFGGRTYNGLSEIASEITGTKWNGPRFFGLRRKRPSITSNAG